MSITWLLVVGAVLVSQQALALPAASSGSAADRLAEEIANLQKILKTGALEYGIPVVDPLDINQIPINANGGGFKASGSLNDLIVDGISSFTVTRLEQTSGAVSGRVSLAIELPAADANLEYDLHGKVKISFINVKLNGKSAVSAKVDGIKANADLDITINPDNSITVDNICNIDFGFHKATVHIDEMSGVVNSLVNKLIPTLVNSNRNKIIQLIETVGKDNINKYFDMVAGKASSWKSIAVSDMLQTFTNELVVSPEAHRILRQIARHLDA
ncbi:uncharacterized protein LOC117651798 [Thrips palmi]|uniref:Uncharacterized protein LOC117651798 n=1 Tax=Thrips palmi TaxID=161013 RepID=A0A6P9A2K7_THRPL|nr:uncharacterized protein LOC117651798 [Thrips palmi]